jgi:hypothetical protein
MKHNMEQAAYNTLLCKYNDLTSSEQISLLIKYKYQNNELMKQGGKVHEVYQRTSAVVHRTGTGNRRSAESGGEDFADERKGFSG